jgi:competence protein ComEC
LLRPGRWLLPGLVVCLLVGVVAGDREWMGTSPARSLAAFAFGVAVVSRRSATVCALCAGVMALALGARSIAHPVEAARSEVVRESVDRAVSARVCSAAAGREWVSVELCQVEPVPFGTFVLGSATPSRLRVIERVATEEGALLAALETGDLLRARLRVEPTRPARNPGGQDRAVEERRRGIAARGRLVDQRLLVRIEHGAQSSQWRDASRAWTALRGRLSQRLQVAGPGGRLQAALALGDRGQLEAADQDAFRRLGISHLLAVSGLHLALVAALAYAAVRRAAVRATWLAARWDVRMFALIAAVVAALAYGMLAGWGVPVRRAWVFVAVSVLVLARGSRRAPAHAIALAAFAIVLCDPAAVFDLGTRLSFVAAGALIGSSGRFEASVGLVARAMHACAASLRVSATAIAVTAPVLAYHGLSSSWLGLISNGIGVPATGLLLLPTSLLAAMIAGLADDPTADQILAFLERPARAALEFARAAAALIPPEPATAPPAATAMVVAAGLAVAATLARHTWVRAALALFVCAVLALGPRAVLRPTPPRIVAFDVGLGDAILVEGRDAALLVDAGWGLPGAADLGRSVVVPGLIALGVERLDVVAVSHADSDHRGGVAAVLEALPVDELWIPKGRGEGPRDGLFELARRAESLGVRVREMGAGDPPEQRGDLLLQPLWPPGVPVLRASRNDRSLVLRVDLAGSRVLLTGDIGEGAEAGLLAAGADLRADVLKLAHHGSRSSSSAGFLAAVGAEIALVSAPCSPRGRLPTPEALARVDAQHTSIWWTGRDGALLVALRSDSPTRVSWGWRSKPSCQPVAVPSLDLGTARW